jgi:integrase/recombinase XerC
VRQLLQAAAAQPDPRKSRRDVALLRLLHDVALRRGEVCRLDLADVDLDRGRLAVTGKGDVERTIIALPAPTQRAIGGWLEARGRDPGPLFLGLDGTGRVRGGVRLSGPGLWSIVRTLGRRAGLVAWPHGLRHTAITRALEATNGDLRKVQRFSRHRDVRAVMHYDDNRTDLGGTIAAIVAPPLDDPSPPDRGT